MPNNPSSFFFLKRKALKEAQQHFLEVYAMATLDEDQIGATYNDLELIMNILEKGVDPTPIVRVLDSLIICDTNLFETMVYSKYYYGGNCDPLLEKYALKNNYDLYLLTDIDIPWEKDDLRDKPNEREESFEIFKNELIKNNIPFELINGTRIERLKKAINCVNKII